MSIFDMAHINLANTPEDKYQDQWMLIQLIPKHSSIINKESIGRWPWNILKTIKTINFREQIWTTNQHLIHNLPQACRGGQIHISNLDMSHRQFSNTTEDKYQVGPVVSNHGNLQNTLLLALGYRALRGLPRCTARGGG